MSTHTPDKNTEICGINVIGHLGSSAGLGVTARAFIELLRSRGIAVAEFDVDAGDWTPADTMSAHSVRDIRKLPFDHNLIVMSLHRLPKFWLRHGRAIVAPRFRNAGLLFWELPVIPSAWRPALRMFDVVLSCSYYVRQAFETSIADVPTVFVEHPLPPQLEREGEFSRENVRRRYGIPDSSLTFCCSFDPRSGIERKNPLGAITAWLNAFPARADVRLLVKSNGPPVHDDAAFDSVLNRARSDPRIVWVSEHLDHRAVMALFASCDIFVSLHRAEGLGLVPMEAMSLGKLVIATGYSGNMTFMTEQNSLPVSYKLVAPEEGRHLLSRDFAGAHASWADPDLDEAARLMRFAAENPEATRQLSEQAHADIRRRQVTSWAGGFIDEMTMRMRTSTRHESRARLIREIWWQELSNPQLRRRNLASIITRLRNRLAR